MRIKSNYYLGLDIGTDSVGYAATDEEYKILKFNGEPIWGVHLFEEAGTGEERRGFRAARRRLDRRQQRVTLVQEIFAKEIYKMDPTFYMRIAESHKFAEDSEYGVALFQDADYTDEQYLRDYPTIHHLICELMDTSVPHDVRLVYLACAWLVAHRGHFLKEVSVDNLEELTDIQSVYREFMDFFESEKPWGEVDAENFGKILRKKIGKAAKYKELSRLIYGNVKVAKEVSEEFPYSREGILKLLCGSQYTVSALFDNKEYAELGSISLDMNDESFDALLADIGDDGEILVKLKSIYDWTVLCDVLRGNKYISQAKVEDYEQHREDLQQLKRLVKKYIPREYNEIFRVSVKKLNNYTAYSGNFQNTEEAEENSGTTQGEFCKYILKKFESVIPQPEDEQELAVMRERLDFKKFMPKQVNGDNRIVPQQVYYVELRRILEQAANYLPFLTESDADGLTPAEKILSVFSFRVPYFVGPLNNASEHAWIRRKAEGRILPWNFEEKVDMDASEQAFIARMTNKCTYLPGKDVLPELSLCYERYKVLNEINTIKINGRSLPAEVKQGIYNDLFMNMKKVTPKRIKDYLLSNNHCTAEDLNTFSGLDETVKSDLAMHRAFARLMNDTLNEEDVEKIIRQAACCEDKGRLRLWLKKEFPALSEEDRRYIAGLKIKGFGRLSEKFLAGMLGVEKSTGEVNTVLGWMWERNLNLMQLLSDRFDFAEQIEKMRAEYYDANKLTLNERLDSMYISNSVKRPIIRAMDIVHEVVKAKGCPPKKIFVEMARGGNAEDKGKRTRSRYQQLCELYAKVDTEDVRQLQAELEAMGEARDSRLQSERLFLYFLQLGKCMYSGEAIDLSKLAGETYNVDHIYPQSKVKDDSIVNNKVLVKSEINGSKNNDYPIAADIRRKMGAQWKLLRELGLINEEKYRRLTRDTPFDENEEWGFINRQLVETRQSTKAVTTLLSEKYPETEIVYVKAGIVSEFRQEFDILKCRSVNDLHHAKDAYLNVVVGNVYSEKFTHQWYLSNKNNYSVKIETIFTNPVTVNGALIWNGKTALEKVINTVRKNNAVHLTRYAFCKGGGFFDLQPRKAGENLVPRKLGLPAEKYGGYRKPAVSFYILAAFTVKKKREVMFVPIELHSRQVMKDELLAREYVCGQAEKIIGKSVNYFELPLGLRPIKINTMLEADGYRMTLSGKSDGGKKVIVSGMMPLIVGDNREGYIKRLERFAEKKKQNPSMIWSEKYDKISTAENIELYDMLCDKLENNMYRKRPANPINDLKGVREKFIKLDISQQVQCLLQMVALFGRTASGCDLSGVGGKPNAGATTRSSCLSNWAKVYKDVRIVDQSVAGLFEKRSMNLLELL